MLDGKIEPKPRLHTLSLKQRALRAGSWSMLGFALTQAIRLGGNLITTRLLVPDMFGVMAIAQVLMFGLALFSDFGLNQSIVQSHRGNDPVFFNTAWVTQILRGAIIGAFALTLSFILAHADFIQQLFADSVYTDRRLPQVIALLSGMALISGFESSKLALANRNLTIGRITQIELFCQLLGLSVMIPWALLSPTIWALVAGGLIPAAARTLLSHWWLPGENNRFAWEPQAFREILDFGKWVLLSSILWFLASSGDRILLGGMISPKIMGLYATAFLLANTLQLALAKLVGSVAFPALSEVMRERPAQLCATYYKIRLPLDLVALFVSGLLFSAGSLVIRILYDHRYAGAGNMLEILALSLIMTRFYAADQCFVAIGKPRILALLNLVRTISLYLLVPIGYRLFGLQGALWAIALNSFAAVPIMFYIKQQHSVLNWTRELAVLPMFFVGLASGKMLMICARLYGMSIT